MADQLKLSILSPERRLLHHAAVVQMTLPSSEGQIQILLDHAPMIGTLLTGIFDYREPGGRELGGVISSGFFEVLDNEVYVTAEIIELSGEINVDRARRAQELAEKILKEADLEEAKFKKYQLKLERSLIRQQVAGREFSST